MTKTTYIPTLAFIAFGLSSLSATAQDIPTDTLRPVPRPDHILKESSLADQGITTNNVDHKDFVYPSFLYLYTEPDSHIALAHVNTFSELQKVIDDAQGWVSAFRPEDVLPDITIEFDGHQKTGAYFMMQTDRSNVGRSVFISCDLMKDHEFQIDFWQEVGGADQYLQADRLKFVFDVCSEQPPSTIPIDFPYNIALSEVRLLTEPAARILHGMLTTGKELQRNPPEKIPADEMRYRL